MIKKFSIIVFLFAFSAQSETLYPTGRKEKSSYGGRTRTSTNATYTSYYKDNEDKIFIEDPEKNPMGDLSEAIKNCRMTPSNSLKKLRPTGYRESDRREDQSIRGLLNKQSAKIQKLIKKIEETLNKNKKISKKKLSEKLGILAFSLRYYIIKIKKKSPQLFKILNEKYPKIFNIKEKSKENIQCVWKKIQTLIPIGKIEKIEKIINQLIKENKNMNKEEFANKLNITRGAFFRYMKKIKKTSPESFKILSEKYPKIFNTKEKSRLSIESVLKKIQKILTENPEIKNKSKLSEMLKTQDFDYFLKKAHKGNFELFKKLSEKYPKIFNTKEKPRLSIQSVLKKIEEILTENPEIKNKSKLSKILNKKTQDFEYFLKKAHKENSELFKKLSEKFPNIFCLQTVLKKLAIPRPTLIIKQIKEIKEIKDIADADPKITKSELCKKLKLSMPNFWHFLKNLEKETPKIFQELNVKYPTIFSIKKYIKKRITIKEIEDILGTDPKSTKSELCKKLKLSMPNFWYFLKNLEKGTPKIFEELNLKYPNIFCLKIYKKNEKKESEFQKIPQNMTIEKIKNKKVARENMLNRIKEVLAANPENIN